MAEPPPPPPRAPLRVLVKGSSAAIRVYPRPAAPSELDFTRWLEASLVHRGQLATVRNASTEGQRLRDAICLWHEQEEPWAPDVVVINHGMYECLHALLPHWLERHVNGRHRHPGPLRQAYRNRVAHPLWRAGVRVQRRTELRIAPLTFARTRETISELAALIDAVKYATNRLVLVMDIWRVGPAAEYWFPGMAARVEALQDAVTQHVRERGDPNVRMFPLRAVLDRVSPGMAADGIHFQADAHRAVGEALATPISLWAESRPRPGSPDDSISLQD